MSPFTLTYTSAMTPDALVLEFDHDACDWAEVANSTSAHQFPGVAFSTANEQSIAKYLETTP